MTSVVAILEKLLDDKTVTFKEHVLETASRHVSDAQTRFEQKFDALVREIGTIWGEPEFNSQIRQEPDVAQTSSDEQKKPLSTVVPPWCQGTPRNGGRTKALRLAHWKNSDGIMYVVLRTELDLEKDRPLYYDLILGARRRKPEMDKNTVKLRQTEKTWQAYVVDFFNWLRGR